MVMSNERYQFAIEYGSHEPTELEKQLSALSKLCQKLERDSEELGQIRATLAVNCAPGRVLATHGCEYDKSKLVLSNLIMILERLTQRKDGEA
jgi:hypothetical protein